MTCEMTFIMVGLDIRRHTFDMEVRISARKKSEKDIACTQQTKTSCKKTYYTETRNSRHEFRPEYKFHSRDLSII